LKHVEDSNKHIIEEIVRHVGYLPELYEDAWFEKLKKKNGVYFASRAVSCLKVVIVSLVPSDESYNCLL